MGVIKTSVIDHVCIPRDPDWVFRELHDPELLLSCVPGGSLTRRIDHRRFEARIAIGLGPFRISYTGSGRIVASDPKSRTASLALTGQSYANMPSVRALMSMAIDGHAGRSEIRMWFEVQISNPGGRLGQAGVDVIARDAVGRIIDRIRQRLEDMPAQPGPAAAQQEVCAKVARLSPGNHGSRVAQA